MNDVVIGGDGEVVNGLSGGEPVSAMHSQRSRRKPHGVDFMGGEPANSKIEAEGMPARMRDGGSAAVAHHREPETKARV